MSSLTKLKIPTLLGLSIILLGMLTGVYVVIQGQNLTTEATPDLNPQNILFSNIQEDSITVSWQTTVAVPGFIIYGSDTALDDRDQDTLQSWSDHHVTIKNLLPETTYQFKIVSGKLTYPKVLSFTTAPATDKQNGFKPVVGSVLSGEEFLSEGVVYLTIPGASIHSAVITSFGNFLIPISNMRTQDLSDIFQPEKGMVGKLKVVSKEGEAQALIHLRDDQEVIGPLKIGQDIDLTLEVKEATPATTDLNKYDLNKDSQINANDHAIVLNNFGRNPEEKKADINQDSVVDDKDLALISKKITELGGKLPQTP